MAEKLTPNSHPGRRWSVIVLKVLKMSGPGKSGTEALENSINYFHDYEKRRISIVVNEA